MELSVIIVNFDTKDLALGCVDSIYKNPPKCEFEIIMIDNGSAQSLPESNRYLLIQNKDNLGFAKANNQGIKVAKGEYILLLNSDTKVTKGAIDKLLEFLKVSPDTGGVAARLLNNNGTVQPSVFRFPTIGRAIRQYWFGKKGLLDKYIPSGDKPVLVDAAVMAAFLICSQTIEGVGMLDERYFMYFEDIDYCRRIKGVGLKIYYVPTALIYHYHGASGKSLADAANQWRRLIPSSKIYHGLVGYYIFNFILWSGQKCQKMFGR